MMRKLIIWAIIIAAALLWSSVIYNSCNKNKKNNQEITVTNNPNGDEDGGSAIDYPDTDIEDEHDDRIGDRDSDEETEDVDDSEEMDFDEEEESDEGTGDTGISDTENNSSSKPDLNTNSRGGGRYLVVAGAFRSKDNAKGMLAKLKRLGYEDAEIVQFNFDEHHAICVARYESLSAARSTAKDLRSDHGIENYVHERRFKRKR